ncbi:MAG: alpha/beta hydrolase, partial [Pseudobdellovibrionaceae bacterium]
MVKHFRTFFILFFLLGMSSVGLAFFSFNPSPGTYTYKTVQKHRLKLDVYKTKYSLNAPVIVWLHGGGLIMGCRTDIAKWQLKEYLEAGYTVISIDYRLAPETKLSEIVSDLRDALGWIRTHGSQSLNIDPSRIAVIGHSAGGYLAQLSGAILSPKPRAVISFYGYGELT